MGAPALAALRLATVTPERLLIVSPAFHGYWRAYEGAFRRLGYEVTALPYDDLPSMRAKARHKLLIELPERLGREGRSLHAREVSARCARTVREHRPDKVLVIRGDLLGEEFWDAVERTGAKPLTLVYDEVARMDTTYEALMSHGPVASYSAHDTAELQRRGATTAHIKDAYDSRLPFTPLPSDDVVFIGAVYGQRAPLIEALHRAGVPVRAYGRGWSHHPLDRLRTWNAPRPDVPASRDVPRHQAYGIQAGAVAALNIHEGQDGFTMRTFEIPGTGGLQFIDRDDVSELYEPGSEVLVFHSAEELIELARRAAVDTAWAARIRQAGRRRTLSEHTFDHRVRELEALWS